jgi:hypothetical protein
MKMWPISLRVNSPKNDDEAAPVITATCPLIDQNPIRRCKKEIEDTCKHLIENRLAIVLQMH